MKFKIELICNNYESNIKKRLYKTNISEISGKFHNWTKNRPEDNLRVDEIKEKIKNTGSIIGEIRIWKKSNNYYIYDGLHRYKAAEKLYNTEKIDTVIYLIIYETLFEKYIIDEFLDINKSVPIPILYVSDTATNFGWIQNVICAYQYKYNDFSKPSRVPQRPNFNRDNVVDIIYDCIKNKEDFDSDKLTMCLNNINTRIRNDIMNNQYYKKTTSNIINKCKKYDFYLFIYGMDYFKNSLESKIDELYNNDLMNFITL